MLALASEQVLSSAMRTAKIMATETISQRWDAAVGNRSASRLTGTSPPSYAVPPYFLSSISWKNPCRGTRP